MSLADAVAELGIRRVMKKPAHEQRMFLLALAAGLPAGVVAVAVLWTAGYTPRVQWTLTIAIVAAWWYFANKVKEGVVSPLRTLASLLEAIREGDYSIRGRGGQLGHGGKDALSDVMQQVNAMSNTLRTQRLGALEATTLLRKVMEEIDVAIFAFDSEQHLRLVNRAGERLLGKASERIMNAPAGDLGLAEFLDGPFEHTTQRTFAQGAGRWGISRAQFREGGLPHQLLVVTDITRALREEELQAWQRLVRVLGHEINNSLAPIKSIAGSLDSMFSRDALPQDWLTDARRGLQIISTRSEGLSRFTAAYAQLAKLPRPTLGQVDVGSWVRHAAALEQRVRVPVEPGPELSIPGDRDQLDQVLINLIRNAADASIETSGVVSVGWRRNGATLEVMVRDRGPGISNLANVFVPFFTTKPGGTGIGLVLSRQIAEAHGGSLELRNRPDGPGCEARLTLPL